MNRKILIAVIALIGLSAGAANAQTSGMCGDSLTWTLTGTAPDLTLTISGTGDMYNYRESTAPWFSQRRNIKTLVLHNGMTSIGNYAFITMFGITSATIPNSVTTIGKNAFSLCFNLTSVIIPNSVTEIGQAAFHQCRLTSVTIPNSVTAIGAFAFFNNDLTSLTIPNSVMKIGENAFLLNKNLTDIYVSWTTPPTDIKLMFDKKICKKNATLHIPQGTLDVYRNARVWKNFINMVEDVTNTE